MAALVNAWLGRDLDGHIGIRQRPVGTGLRPAQQGLFVFSSQDGRGVAVDVRSGLESDGHGGTIGLIGHKKQLADQATFVNLQWHKSTGWTQNAQRAICGLSNLCQTLMA